MSVDGVNLVLRNRRRAVEHDGESRKLLLDLVQDVECQWRRNELASLRVACALLRSELVSAVACADRDSQAVATAASSKVDYLFGLCVVTLFGLYLVLNACEYAELSLNGYVVSVSIFNYLLGDADVLLVRKRAAIEHNAGETIVDAVLAELEAIAVVEVKNNLRILATEFLGVFYSTLSHIAKDGAVCIVARALADLHDDGRLCLYGSLHDGLHLFECVEVESWDGIAASNCLFEHLTGVHQAEFFVTCHSDLRFNYLLYKIMFVFFFCGCKDTK